VLSWPSWTLATTSRPLWYVVSSRLAPNLSNNSGNVDVEMLRNGDPAESPTVGRRVTNSLARLLMSPSGATTAGATSSDRGASLGSDTDSGTSVPK
jgi:hypothetical protein